MLHDLLQFFSNNPWLNILFLLLALFGITLSLVFYFKSKKEKLPTYSKKTINVIQNSVIKSNKLEVKYNGSSVENLSITEFAFWNSGRETIRGIDIATNDPLIIKSKSKIILYDFEVSFKNNVNNFQIQKTNENSLKITFDFIDLNQGIKIKIYHSGNVSSDVFIKGTIVGSEQIQPGIKKGLLMNKLDIIATPVRFLTASKIKLLNICGYILGIVIVLPIFVLLAFLILPIEYIFEKIRNKHPKEFLLYD